MSGLDLVVREVLAQQARNPGGPVLEVSSGACGMLSLRTHAHPHIVGACGHTLHPGSPGHHPAIPLQELVVEGCPLLTHQGLRAATEASAEAGRPLLAALRHLNLSQSAGGPVWCACAWWWDRRRT